MVKRAKKGRAKEKVRSVDLGEAVISRLLLLLTLFLITLYAGTATAGKVKNIILVIGDGMGPGQLGLLFTYGRQAPNSIYRNKINAIEQMMSESTMGMMLTPPHNGLVVDSACSATQLATGQPALSEVVGLDTAGRSAPTILELAAKRGMATGLVTDTRITHATPAAFAAHVPSRHMEVEIAGQLLLSPADLLFGGGARYFTPAAMGKKKFQKRYQAPFAMKSHRKDERNLLEEAKANGFSLLFSREQMERYQDKKGRVLGLFSKSGMPDGIEERDTIGNPKRTTPLLSEMTGKALKVLSSKGNKGFFLMVEAGQIDWAGHHNDVGTMLLEMVKLERTIKTILEWAKGRDDTLVVLTADHETGGFGFAYSLYNVPGPKPPLAPKISMMPYQVKYNYGDPHTLDRIYQQKRSFIWMLESIKRLAPKKRTAKRLHQIIAPQLEFKVTKKDVKGLLKQGKNRYYIPGHWGAGTKEVVKICDFAAYYTSMSKRLGGALGRMIADQQGVVWGTGTHTATPVMVISHGPKEATSKLKGLLQSYEVGQRLISLLPLLKDN
jgi:alkaline phosphatase